jgi:uncharacterized protein with FMN-binding domain
MTIGLGRPALSSSFSKDERLAGKLLLSTALVALSVGYAWMQHGVVTQQQAAVIAAMQAAQAQPMTQTPMTQTPMTEAPMTQAPAQQAAVPDAPAQSAPAPDGTNAGNTASAAAASPAPKSTTLAMAAPPAAASQAAPQQNVLLPAAPVAAPPPPGLTGMAAIRSYIPTEGVSPPLPITTGTPNPGANPPIPAGTHLEDGEYQSDKVQFEWGDLRVKIVVAAGKMTGVQILSYPDHRSTSLYLIQLADPILNNEVIKTQQAKVDIVSSATNSSYAYQDAVANALMKATRTPQ